ncbi:PTS sugar transporter subunit IIA [uncultured Dubosiella sp.]|uniref:PTS sugar transporter subunit IIA n=1 Tax=uncultured Dubosiella sp. TaxID=1937011 RepID=UPI00273071FD|nr:PTS sugar transporter subunit IIA [uncultured Dubosiella sp.]
MMENIRIKLFFCPEITRLETVADWKAAVHEALFPLESHGLVSEEYEKAIIQRIEQLGSYCVLKPGLALVHGPIAPDAKQAGIHILVVEKPVYFPASSKPVFLFIGVCAPTAASYMRLIKKMAPLLHEIRSAESFVERSNQDILEYFAQLGEFV